MFSAASVCLSVCQFVCQHFRIIKRRMLKLGGCRRTVQKSRPSSNLGIKDQRSKSPGTKKRKSAAFCSGVVLWGAVPERHFFGSGPRGRGYAGGKISACMSS